MPRIQCCVPAPAFRLGTGPSAHLHLDGALKRALCECALARELKSQLTLRTSALRELGISLRIFCSQELHEDLQLRSLVAHTLALPLARCCACLCFEQLLPQHAVVLVPQVE